MVLVMSELLSGRRVLVVEDEFLILRMIEVVLADLGCESVSTAPTVSRAIASLDAQPFDLAMLDLKLRGEMSFPVADALAARGVPFAFSTGYNDHELEDRYLGRPVLKKPFQASKLQEVLAMLLPSTEQAWA